MAVIVMEFLLDKILLGMGKVFKRVIAAAKVTRAGQKVMKGVNFVRKGTTRVGNVVRKGVARIKNTRLVVRMQGVVGKGTKKLSNLRQKILDKFKFKRIWLEKSGRWIELWGEFNAKLIIVRERTDDSGDTHVSHGDVNGGGTAGINPRNSGAGDQSLIGNRPAGTRKQVVVSDDYYRRLDELKGSNPRNKAYQDELAKLNDALKANKGKDEIRDIVKARRGATSAHSKQLGDNMTAAGKTRPKNTAAHHMVASTDPRAATSRSILKAEGIDFNDAANGVFLKTSSKYATPPAITHSVIHTNKYFAEVERRLIVAQAKGPGHVRAALVKMEKDILAGTFKYK